MSDHSPKNPRTGWADRPQTVDWIVKALYLCCTALFLADFFYHKHAHFPFEQWIGFFALYGFFSYCFIVLSAKQLRKLLKRDESYYD